MHLIYGTNDWKDAVTGEQQCYLLTNGLGGFSSLTITGANARNDQALLMASLNAPVTRYHMVTNITETVETEGRSYNLSAQRFVDQTKNGNGYEYIDSFDYEYLPTWYYRTGNVRLKKSICMIQGENTVAVLYEVKSPSDGILTLEPWFQFVPKGEKTEKTQVYNIEDNKIISNNITLYFDTNGEVCEHETVFNEDLYYEQDAVDGRFAVGCDASNHKIQCKFNAGNTKFYVVYHMSEENPIGLNEVEDMFTAAVSYKKEFIDKSGLNDPVAKMLAASAADYITKRESTKSKSMIAGYPFFGDWGRDTMIAIAGCAIVTGQYQTVREILRSFMSYCKEGLMPNMFPEENEEPIYNTVDASLLFIEVVYLYYQASGDNEFVKEALPVMESIIKNYTDGTEYGIYMDNDGLIAAGKDLWQVTWMDVRYEDILPTKRHGKPVEINAYWYNALKIMEEFSDDDNKKKHYSEMAAKTKDSFLRLFWDEKRGYLKDVISGEDDEEQIRCNQVWALSMSFVMLDQDKALKILDVIYKHLYTPWGLRSLSPEDREYHGFYGGSQKDRDLAYHQGTVWAYPLGAYYRARIRFAKDQKEEIQNVKEQLMAMDACIREGCVGQIAEIYDGDRPVKSKGCFAQAWSVGEILRVYDMIEKLER